MIATEDIGKFYYLFPQTVTLVSVKENLMPAAWHTPISATPPLYGVSISPKRFTCELLIKENGFTINFLGIAQASLIARLGSTSGRVINKLKKFKIKFSQAKKVPGIIMEDCDTAFECEKFSYVEYGDHFFFIGKVVMVYYREGIVSAAGVTDERKVSPVLYFGRDRYLTIDPNTLKVIERL